ncbi:MAG: hypothetical protein OXG39_12220 [Chloroflexi bacterium]|nr:hypothetical protein [Chloroflexota bacterium]
MLLEVLRLDLLLAAALGVGVLMPWLLKAPLRKRIAILAVGLVAAGVVSAATAPLPEAAPGCIVEPAGSGAPSEAVAVPHYCNMCDQWNCGRVWHERVFCWLMCPRCL